MKSPGSARKVVDPTEYSLLRECGEWFSRLYAAEHAVFMAENGTPGIIGSHCEYQWLTTVDFNISSRLRLCPDIVLKRYLAVTSNDSSPLRLKEQAIRDGWWEANEGNVYNIAFDGVRKCENGSRVGSTLGAISKALRRVVHRRRHGSHVRHT